MNEFQWNVVTRSSYSFRHHYSHLNTANVDINSQEYCEEEILSSTTYFQPIQTRSRNQYSPSLILLLIHKPFTSHFDNTDAEIRRVLVNQIQLCTI